MMQFFTRFGPNRLQAPQHMAPKKTFTRRMWITFYDRFWRDECGDWPPSESQNLRLQVHRSKRAASESGHKSKSSYDSANDGKSGRLQRRLLANT